MSGHLHDDKDNAVFNSVIVITDRRVLDKQLQDSIYQLEHKHGVVQKIDKDSNQLAEAVTDGTRIIISTLQKFPFIIEKVGELEKQKYAVIIDEAQVIPPLAKQVYYKIIIIIFSNIRILYFRSK